MIANRRKNCETNLNIIYLLNYNIYTRGIYRQKKIKYKYQALV